MKDIISILIMPFNVLWVLLFIGLLLLFFKRFRIAMYLFIISLVWLFTITTAFIPAALVHSLENRYSALKSPECYKIVSPVYIIVLGAGHSDDSNLTSNSQLSVLAVGRLVEGIRLQRLIPGSILVTSGSENNLSVSQASVMADCAFSLGIDSLLIRKLTTTKNTADEARTFFSRFGKEGTLFIVTDAIHMPRAMQLFKDQGLSPVAAPTNYFLKNNSFKNKFWWGPSSGNIFMMEYAMHEYTGLLWILLGGEAKKTDKGALRS